MLPHIYRLTKKKDFETLFTQGKSQKHQFLFIKILDNTLPHHRFGFVVSKKISLRATTRNTIRRRLRSVVAKELPHLRGHKDIVIVALAGIQTKSFIEIQKNLQELLSRIS